jgi:hypothetical protein
MALEEGGKKWSGPGQLHIVRITFSNRHWLSLPARLTPASKGVAFPRLKFGPDQSRDADYNLALKSCACTNGGGNEVQSKNGRNMRREQVSLAAV